LVNPIGSRKSTTSPPAYPCWIGFLRTHEQPPLTSRPASRAFGRVGSDRRPLALWALYVVITTGLSSCADYLVPRYGPWPEVVFSDKPVQIPMPPPQELAAASDAERHVFAIVDQETVVGTVGTLVLRPGDTLSDVARHFGLGYEEIVAANPGLDPWVIDHPTRALVPLRFVLPQAPRQGLVINLAAMRLYHYPASRHGTQAVTYPVGIGREGRPTPTGGLFIVRKATNPTWRPTRHILNDHLKRGDPLPAVVPPGPDNPLGAYAMYLSAPRYLIHGTNKPYSVGLRASNGCIRLYPEDVEALFPTVAVKEPVTIVNQPYLIGIRGGNYYLQAYRPHEELNEPAARQRLRDELKRLETERLLVVDWPRVERILNEARGIPFPIGVQASDMEAVIASATELPHPATFYGQPQPPPEDSGAWHVVAAELASEPSARRTVAILQHLGLPARLGRAGEGLRVVAGPFADAQAAQKAATRLKVDLDLDSQVLAPDPGWAGVPPSPVSSTPQSLEPAGSETTSPDTDMWTPASPEGRPPEGPTPLDTPFEGPAVPTERAPEMTTPGGPAPEEPASAVPEPSTPEPYYEAVPGSAAVPPDTSRSTSGAPETTEPLDGSIPEPYYSREAPARPSDAPPLEFPPDLTPSTVKPAPGAGEPQPSAP
jgi:L,D-transpeptidase ErfK/SrfK